MIAQALYWFVQLNRFIWFSCRYKYSLIQMYYCPLWFHWSLTQNHRTLYPHMGPKWWVEGVRWGLGKWKAKESSAIEARNLLWSPCSRWTPCDGALLWNSIWNSCGAGGARGGPVWMSRIFGLMSQFPTCSSDSKIGRRWLKTKLPHMWVWNISTLRHHVHAPANHSLSETVNCLGLNWLESGNNHLE